MSTKAPIQLISPVGSAVGQSLVSTGPTTPPVWASAGSVTLELFGAVGDGVTDDSTAINSALASGSPVVKGRSDKTYRCASGVLVPPNVSLISDGITPGSQPGGLTLLFDLSVATCLTLGGNNGNNHSVGARQINVVRAAGTPPAGSVGVMFQNVYQPIADTINSVNHAIGVLFKNDHNAAGISVMGSRLFTGSISDAHMVFDGWPEAHITLSRFGSNNGNDLNANCYVRVMGGSTTNVANGPNTILFDNCQFNLGGAHVNRIIEFVNAPAGNIADVALYKFDGCHIESFLTGIYSDATWPTISNVSFANTSLGSAVEMFALNAGSSLFQFFMSNSSFGGTMTFPPASHVTMSNNQISGAVTTPSATATGSFAWASNVFDGAVTLNSASSASSLTSAADIFHNGLAVSGPWGNLNINSIMSGGTYANTATGKWSVSLPGVAPLAWTPGISFGGATTGIAYSTQAGAVEVVGNEVTAQFQIILSNVGSATGNALITGLPVAIAGGTNANSSNGSGGCLNYYANMAGLTGAILTRTPAGNTVDLYQTNATGLARVTNANFTSTSTIAGTVRYFR